MPSDKIRFPFQGVVLVADLIADSSTTPAHLRRDLEQTDRETLDDLCTAITRLGLTVHHYSHPKVLAHNAGRHGNDMVLSIFGGQVSRSRMALVPAVCESMGLSYVGPDAYGRIICQDKEVSKAIAAEAGLRLAPHRIVRSPSDLSKLLDFPLPYVAKPLWEGSSIGIGPASLITDRAKGVALVAELLGQLDQPVMVETFVPGREVSYCFIEAPGRDAVRSFAESVWGNETDHFDYHLFDSAHKAEADTAQTIRSINDELDPRTAGAMERLLRFLGPIGYGRIDGKLEGRDFTFLEITPDAWLGASGTFVNSFRDFGLSFDEVIARILLSGRLNHRDRSTSD